MDFLHFFLIKKLMTSAYNKWCYNFFSLNLLSMDVARILLNYFFVILAFFIIILEKQVNIFISAAVRDIFRNLYNSWFEAWVGYFVDILRLIQEQIKYCAFTRHKVIVIKETWITQFPFFLKFLMEINFTLNTNFHF